MNMIRVLAATNEMTVMMILTLVMITVVTSRLITTNTSSVITVLLKPIRLQK